MGEAGAAVIIVVAGTVLLGAGVADGFAFTVVVGTTGVGGTGPSPSQAAVIGSRRSRRILSLESFIVGQGPVVGGRFTG